MLKIELRRQFIYIAAIAICIVLVVGGYFWSRIKANQLHGMREKLPPLGQVTGVELLVVPDIVRTAVPVTASQVLSSGCEYKTTDPKVVANIVDILLSEDFVPDVPESKGEHRQALFIHAGNGQSLYLSFGWTKAGFSVDFKDGQGKLSRGLIADGKFDLKLYKWASQVPMTEHGEFSYDGACKFYMDQLEKENFSQ